MQNLDNLSNDCINLLFISKNIALNMSEETISLEHLMLSFTFIDSPVKEFFDNINITFDYINKKLFKSLVDIKSLDSNFSIDNIFLQLERRVANCFDSISTKNFNKNQDLIYPEDLFVSILKSRDVTIKNLIRFLFGPSINKKAIPFLNEFDSNNGFFSNDSNSKIENSNTNLTMENLLNYGVNLNKFVLDKKQNCIIQRDLELTRIIEVLGRQYKNNPCLIGEPGVGKTSIIEYLAYKINNKDVPEFLQSSIIISLDIAAIVAGTKYRGDFEARLKSIIDEARLNPNVILFIDEIHTISVAGGSDGAINCSNILKPYLARGDIKCIGSTTFSEYKKHIEIDSALSRRFQKIAIQEPSIKDSILMLKNSKSSYEKFHKISISNEALEAAVILSSRYITDKYLPDKAFDLLDEACSKIKISSKGSSVDNRDIADVLYRATGIPIVDMNLDLAKTFLNLDKNLSDKVIGQEDAIASISKALIRSNAGLKDENKPIASFIFDGSTGVGKTYLAQMLSKFIFNTERNLIRIDMSEYMEKWSVSKLLGSTPGYVGYGDGGILTEAVRRQPYSVLLLDEIEKAHPDVINIFLQILDYGSISDGEGHKIDCKNTIIIFTSNLYNPTIKPKCIGLRNTNATNEINHKEEAIKLFESTFSPEFVNRIDDIIVFNSLDNVQLTKILDLFISELQDKLIKKGITLSVNKKSKSFLLSKCDCNNFGARQLRRIISTYLENDISLLILQDKLCCGDKLKITFSANSLHFDVVPSMITTKTHCI